MLTGIAVHVPHHLAEDYRSQGWDLTPLAAPHGAYGMLATREDAAPPHSRVDVPRTIEQAQEDGV